MKVRLKSGEEADAIAMEGHLLELESPRAFAPGSPVLFTVTIGGDERAFEGRAIGSKRTEAGRFAVRVRLVNVRREDRERLLRALTS